MTTNLTGFITNKESRATEHLNLTLQCNEGVYDATINTTINEDVKKFYGSANDLKTAIGDLINNVDENGFFISNISGYKELDSNELQNYMFDNFTYDFKIPFTDVEPYKEEHIEYINTLN